MKTKSVITTTEIVETFENAFSWLEIDDEMMLYQWIDSLDQHKKSALKDIKKLQLEIDEIDEKFNNMSLYYHDDDQLSEMQSQILDEKLTDFFRQFGYAFDMHTYI